MLFAIVKNTAKIKVMQFCQFTTFLQGLFDLVGIEVILTFFILKKHTYKVFETLQDF